MPPDDSRIPRGALGLLNTTPLDQLVDSYLDLTWNLDPSAATAAGMTEYDHRLALYDEETVGAHVAALQSVANSLEALEIESLDDEIDRTALLNKIRLTTHRFTKERTHQRNPVFWLGHLLESLHLLLVFQDRSPEHVANGLRRRLGEIPAFLDRARETLHTREGTIKTSTTTTTTTLKISLSPKRNTKRHNHDKHSNNNTKVCAFILGLSHLQVSYGSKHESS